MDNQSGDDEFYFETDHLALRTNKDYRAMIRHIVSLECHKMILIKDVEELYASQKKALDDPLNFVNDLKLGNLNFPPSYNIPEPPTINWSQYGVSQEAINAPKEKTSDSEQEQSNILIRGRIYDQTKPQTFNQLWTCEEQKRLEELLKEFPDEEVEMRRWAKIANALGNRTPKQVMSRVQKYFLKLQRAGLPVPGRYRRGPMAKAANANRHQRNKVFQKRSTFFPAHNVPVLMEENLNGESQDIEYDQPSTWTPVELMRAVYERRKIEEMSQRPLPIHKGISCCKCKCQSIVGTRWTESAGTNWCSDCLVEYQPSTKMIPIDAPDVDP